MSFTSVNPATGGIVQTVELWGAPMLEKALARAAGAAAGWADTPVERRADLLRKAANVLRTERDHFATTITMEMGKLRREALAEVDKCALGCEYYADHAAAMLADEPVATDAGRSLVAFQPLGTVLAVMPWNFPFWQAFRCAAPALAAGNTMLLKHASNVPRCAIEIERVFRAAGFPEGVFQSVFIGSAQVAGVIADRRVSAVTLTGSEAAGRAVGETAGSVLKKCVLELGGSDAFVVLEDADLDLTVAQAVTARFQNAGQSCIAAKRFIVVDAIADDFLARFKSAVEVLRPGDPLDEATTLAPLARLDLRDDLHRQVEDSLAAGARAVTGCHPLPGPGSFYAPSILDDVHPGMPAWDDELFGPVAAVRRVPDAQAAIQAANDTRFGLGGSVWTRDLRRGEAIARRLECGAAFVNGMVKSDPRLPFGGVKDSGFGRELSVYGLREFVNVKTIWMR